MATNNNTSLRERIALLETEARLRAQNETELQALYALGASITQDHFDRIELLDTENERLDANLSTLTAIREAEAARVDAITSQLEISEDYESSIVSIGNLLGKQSKLYSAQEEQLTETKNLLGSISTIIQSNVNLNDKDQKNIAKLGAAYANNSQSIAEANKMFARGKIDEESRLELIKRARESYNDVKDELEFSVVAQQELNDLIVQMNQRVKSTGDLAEKSSKQLGMVHDTLDQIGSSGIPAMDKVSAVLKKLANGGVGVKITLAALGAELGKLAWDYFGAPLQIAIEAANEIKKDAITTAQQIAQSQNKAMFIPQQAAMDMKFELKQMAIQFEATSKTALFGGGLGSISYSAGLLQKMGFSAEQIASATSDASKAGNGSAQLAADMMIVGDRTGLSVDNVSKLTSTFRMLDGVSASTAVNMVEGTRALAEASGMNIGDVMSEMASASEVALNAQRLSSAELAKQVIAAKSMGLSYSEIAKAGQDMVLNYKDSISSEIQLSSLLGKSVDLSEYRQLMAENKTDEAMNVLRNMPELDPANMTGPMALFKKQLVAQATGQSIETLTKNAQPSGWQEDAKKGMLPTGKEDLAASNAKAANDAFLALKLSAEQGMNIATAYLAVEQFAESALLAEEINKSWLQSEPYVQTQTALKQLEMQAKITENIGGLLSGIAGLLGMNALTKLLPGAAAAVPSTAIAEGGSGIMSSLANGLGGTGKVALGTAAKSTGAIFGGITAAGVEGYSEYSENKAMNMGTEENAARTAQVAVGSGLGAWGGAAAGAAIGSAIFPVVGTIIGGILGGAIGAWAGKSVGKKAGDLEYGAKGAKVKAAVTATVVEATKAKVEGDSDVSKLGKDITVKEHSPEKIQTKHESERIAVAKSLSSDTMTGAGLNLQQQMVALLTATTDILADLLDVTGKATNINVDGKKLAQLSYETAAKRYTAGAQSNPMKS